MFGGALPSGAVLCPAVACLLTRARTSPDCVPAFPQAANVLRRAVAVFPGRVAAGGAIRRKMCAALHEEEVPEPHECGAR